MSITRSRFHRALAVAGMFAAAACGDGDGPTGGQPIPGSSAIAVSGHGVYVDRFTAEVAVRGTTAYTSTWSTRGNARGNAIMIWDVAGETPQLVDSVIVEPNVSTTGDVAVSDDGSLLVVATEGAPGHVVVYDLADPRKPRELSRFTTTGGGGVHTAEIGRVDGTLYAVLAANGALTPSRVIIVDLSVPTAPRQVFSRDLSPGFMHDAYLRDGHLFLALWDDGLEIWDVGGAGRGGTPANPVFISRIETVGGAVHNVWWFHNTFDNNRRYVFVGEEGPANFFTSSTGDIHVVDISDIDHPREVAFYRVQNSGTHNFSMDEATGILYAAYYNAGVRALDVLGDLGACGVGERGPDGRCDLGRMGRELATGLTGAEPVYIWGVQHTGAFVYASDMLSGLWKLRAVGRGL